ncbi:MAG: outer membrane beta-barrel protein [Bacteroidia bacterium]|nr:outer membrane beta-barrel protein [Bacteroidia bacterium]
MKKTILKMIAVAGIVTGSVLSTNAQIAIGLTGGLGLPMGDMSDKTKMGADLGFGGGITARYFLTEKLAVGLNASYFSFGVKDLPSGASASIGVMPISVAFDYYLMTEGLKPFLGLEAGIVNNSPKASGTISGINFESSASKTGLLVAPVVGIAYGLTDEFDISLNAKYMFGMTDGKIDFKSTANGTTQNLSQDWFNTTYIGINLGISYKLGN